MTKKLFWAIFFISLLWGCGFALATGGSGGEDRLTENVTLNFAKMEVVYTPQKEDGTGDAEINLVWNIEKNVEE